MIDCKKCVHYKLCRDFVCSERDMERDCGCDYFKERPQWIPCSERLPESGEIVLVSFKTGMVQMCKFFDSGRDDSWWSYKDITFAWDNTVIAWMPLPKPYQKEG